MPKLEVDQQAAARADLRDARDALVTALQQAVLAGLGPEDVAEAIGIPPRTVRSLTHNWLEL